ncbi:MAG: hypothetical protein NC827_05745 [Candidatus Omnitrophica bacterium]|nr:hypothetical protein [Candidatus Omnitrophota bacterium]MCM8802792.1 hypothetical protein [Candidatus Omnitrophota bacterium]
MAFFPIILKGISGIFLQSIILREIFSSFFGNELLFSIVISYYLLGGALGSYIFRKIRNYIRNYIFLTILEILLLIFFIPLLRFSSNISQLLSNLRFFIFSFLLSFSCGFFEGGRFILLSFLYKDERSSGKVYGFEGIGFLIGGFLFYFLLFFKKDIFFLILFSSFFNFLTILYFKKSLNIISILILILCLTIISEKIELATLAKKYTGFDIVENQETFFNKITVIKKENQYIFLSNGFQEWTNQTDYFSVKNIAFFSLAYCKKNERVGIYGNPEIIEEIKKYNVREIYFFDIDKEKFKFINKYLLKSDINQVYFLNDINRFLKENKIKFDCFVINSGLPMTIRENYFFTQEFFEKIKENTENLLIVLPGTYDYLGQTLLNFHSSIYNTGKKYFKNQQVIFTYPMMIVFSNNELKLNKLLSADWEFFNDNYLNFVTDEIKKKQYFEKLIDITDNLNEISNQTCLYNSILYYISCFSSKLEKILNKFFSVLNKMKNFMPIIFIILFFISLFSFRCPYLNIIFTNGFSSLTFETIFIFLFQIYYGFVYGFISGIIGIFMTGLSFGSLISVLKSHSKKTVYNSEIIHFLFYLFTYLLLSKIRPYLFLIFFSGFFTGWEFGIISYLVRKENIVETTGKLYSIDLIGALFSSLFLPVLLIPLFGIYNCLLLIVVLKFSNFLRLNFLF